MQLHGLLEVLRAATPYRTALRGLRADPAAWRERTPAARADYDAWQQRPPAMRQLEPALDLWHVVQQLRERVPPDTIVTNGAGNFSGWAHRYWRYGGLRTQLAPTSGSMGYGLPAGIAAKLVAPERTVLTFAGDGDFLMTAQELATAALYRAGVLILIFNNGMYGTIRMHQERHHPARVIGTELLNPRFDLLAQSFGGFGAVVESSSQFGPALEAALSFIGSRKLPAVIELRTDAQVITPGTTLAAIRAAALASR